MSSRSEDARSDAVVLLGATGDLAHRKIYPALKAMVKRGTLDAPVIGVARSGWNLEQFQERVRDSLDKRTKDATSPEAQNEMTLAPARQVKATLSPAVQRLAGVGATRAAAEPASSNPTPAMAA